HPRPAAAARGTAAVRGLSERRPEEAGAASRGGDLGAAERQRVPLQPLTLRRRAGGLSPLIKPSRGSPPPLAGPARMTMSVMKPVCGAAEHLRRRAFLKAGLVTATGHALANWGGLFHTRAAAAEAAKKGKRCILLWMAGGPSHLDTFDMKPGRPGAGAFRPIA